MAAHEKHIAWRLFGRSVLQGLIAGILLGGAFIAGYLYHARFSRPTATTDYSLLQEAEALLERHFLYDLPPQEKLVYGAAAGMVAALNDPYTYFAEPQTAELDKNNLDGSFGGVGAEIGVDEQGRYVIAQVYADNPAEAAGLKAGDIILAVDGTEVHASSIDMNGLLAAIRGPVGEPVELTLQRGEEVFTVEIVRAEVLLPSVFARVLEEDPRVGYIQITRFTNRTASEMREAISDLRRQGVEAYVLDLRHNGGGLVNAAVDVVSEFLDGGVVLYETRQGGEERTFSASRGGAATEEPLVVLVNGGTASASEIVAGALQDRERAVLVGEQTFGKGSVQLILTLSDSSSLHVTTAEWYTPNRHRLQDQGLTPDIPVESDEDGQAALSAALEYLNSELAVAEVSDGAR